MTLPDEEKMSLQHTGAFLISLLNPKLTPRVPKKIRDEARRCLRHYPANYKIEILYEGIKHV